eukprot:TRINITY_DN4747_c0_g2_i1.p1 TRINITY_DN4747_c0_g2~~TRINITY_DN4747_c0_g2_i1.p1  ORF type:complete len:385 (-),score=107.99 TRINITY_DN4747_c0_g2_i1:47-1201(-)
MMSRQFTAGVSPDAEEHLHLRGSGSRRVMRQRRYVLFGCALLAGACLRSCGFPQEDFLDFVAPGLLGRWRRAAAADSNVGRQAGIFDGLLDLPEKAKNAVEDNWNAVKPNSLVEVSVPATTKQVIEAIKDTLMESLKKGASRTDIELPPGLRLGGIEGPPDTMTLPREELTKERVDRADRDLGRFVAILFQAVADRVCIVFRTAGLAKTAQRVFKKAGTGANILYYSKSAGKAAFSTADSDADRFVREVKAAKCELLAMVAPRAKQLKAVEKLSDDMGEDLGIMLLNARLRFREKMDDLMDRMTTEYNPIFYLAMRGEPGQEGVIYHEARAGKGAPQGPWILAQKRLEVGEEGEAWISKEFSRFDKMPSPPEVEKAFAAAPALA